MVRLSACDTCHKRKVRCDSANGLRCSNCLRAGIDCTFVAASQYRRRRRAARPLVSRADGLRNTPPASATCRHPSTAGSENHVPGAAVDFLRQENRDEQDPGPASPPLAPEEDRFAGTALKEFYNRNTSSAEWPVLAEGQNLRIAYVGTSISNLACLAGAATCGEPGSARLHLPFSVRASTAWKPAADNSLLRWYSNIAEQASALPPKDVRDQLVEDFFSRIHPGFPIVDEQQFKAQYGDPTNPPPLLLLQAVLLAGAHVTDHPKIADSRSLVKAALFRRAKALLDIHHENDRMHVVQAALLFTWHFEGPDDVSANGYYWAGIACRTAFGLGMHRDLSSTAQSRMPLGDRRIYRRIWWTTLQVDIFTSLHYGRPPMIDLDESDQPMLEGQDFVEYCGSANTKVDIPYCVNNAKLALVVYSVLKLASPGSLRRLAKTPDGLREAQNELETELARWHLGLPESLLSPPRAPSSFWSYELRMRYNLALLHLHRDPFRNFPAASSFGWTVNATSSEIRHNAALSIARLFDDIQATGTINRCSFTSRTAVLGAAIQLSDKVNESRRSGGVLLALQAQNELENLLPTMTALSKYWPSAETIRNLFRGLASDLKRETRAAFEAVPGSSNGGLNDQEGVLPGISYAGRPYPGLPDHDQRPLLPDSFDTDWINLLGVGECEAHSDSGLMAINNWLAQDLQSPLRI